MLSKNLRDAFREFDERDPESANRRALASLFIDIALTLTRLREKSGLSKRELARRVNGSHPTIVQWETPGYTGYSLSKLAEVAGVLGYDISVKFSPKEELQIAITYAETSSWREYINADLRSKESAKSSNFNWSTKAQGQKVGGART